MTSELAREAVARGAQQKPDELADLLELLDGRRLERVLEIGSFRGGTAWLWAQLADVVVAIDRAPLFSPELVTILIADDSHDPSVVELAGEFAPFDLIFIDGDHSYEGVAADFLNYAPLIRPGGLVVLHDVCEHEAGSEVSLFWTELRERFEHTELIREPRHWGGFGVVLGP